MVSIQFLFHFQVCCQIVLCLYCPTVHFLYDSTIFIINVCYYIVYHQLLTLSKLPSFMFYET